MCVVRTVLRIHAGQRSDEISPERCTFFCWPSSLSLCFPGLIEFNAHKGRNRYTMQWIYLDVVLPKWENNYSLSVFRFPAQGNRLGRWRGLCFSCVCLCECMMKWDSSPIMVSRSRLDTTPLFSPWNTIQGISKIVCQRRRNACSNFPNFDTPLLLHFCSTPSSSASDVCYLPLPLVHVSSELSPVFTLHPFSSAPETIGKGR